MKTYNLQSTRQRIRRRRTTVQATSTGALCFLCRTFAQSLDTGLWRSVAPAAAIHIAGEATYVIFASLWLAALFTDLSMPCGSSIYCIGASHKCALPSVTHFCPKSRHRTLAITAGRNPRFAGGETPSHFRKSVPCVHCHRPVYVLWVVIPLYRCLA